MTLFFRSYFIWKESEGGAAIGVNHDFRVRLRRQELEPEFAENGAVYVFSKDQFKARKHRFFGKIALYPMHSASQYEIDNEADLEIVSSIITNRDGEPESGACPYDLTQVKMLVFDFDGVFTGDTVVVSESGEESVVCSRADGMGISLLRNKSDMPIYIVSTETNRVVQKRASKLKTECMQAVTNKAQVIEEFASRNGLSMRDVMFVGNDVNDLNALEAVGFPVLVKNAHPSLAHISGWRLDVAGGDHAVRRICDEFLTQNTD